MVFVHKGGFWWLLLLAGVLLAAAAVSAEQEDGATSTTIAEVEVEEEVGQRVDDSNNMCDIKCQHWHDPAGRRRCVNECHSREHHHSSRAFCKMKCQHHYHDPSGMERYVDQCMSYGLNLHADSNNGINQHPQSSEVEVGRRVDDQGNDMCDTKCQHWQDPAGRRRCVNECHSREHHHSSRVFCEMKCQHHYHDPSGMERCVHQCMSYGLNLRAGSNNGVDQHPHGWGTVAGAIVEVV